MTENELAKELGRLVHTNHANATEVARELGRLASASEEYSRQLESMASKLDAMEQSNDKRLCRLEQDVHAAKVFIRTAWVAVLAIASFTGWLWGQLR